MQVVLKRATSNAKLTGGTRNTNVWVVNPADTYDTCPTTCRHLPRSVFDRAVLNGLPVADDPTHACYANGRVAAMAVKGGERLDLTDAVSVIIADAPQGALIRWAEVGDVMFGDARTVVNSLTRIRTERPDITLIAYTHAWRVLGGVGADIFRASCETALEVLIAESMGYRAAITVPMDWTPDDAVAFGAETTRTFICPAAQGRGSCVTCRACDTSDHAVAFPAHGTRKAHAGKGI